MQVYLFLAKNKSLYCSDGDRLVIYSTILREKKDPIWQKELATFILRNCQTALKSDNTILQF